MIYQMLLILNFIMVVNTIHEQLMREPRRILSNVELQVCFSNYIVISISRVVKSTKTFILYNL